MSIHSAKESILSGIEELKSLNKLKLAEWKVSIIKLLEEIIKT